MIHGNKKVDTRDMPNRLPSDDRWTNKFRHRGFWTWEVKPLPDRKVGSITVLSSEFTGRKIYLRGTAVRVV